MPKDEIVPVEQVDREAAADAIYPPPFKRDDWRAMELREGGRDDHPLVQAFARHRLTALSTDHAGIAAAAKVAIDEYDASVRDDSCNERYAYRALGKIRSALSLSPAQVDDTSVEAVAWSAYERGYRNGHEDRLGDDNNELPIELLVRECAPEGFAQWKADNPALLTRALPFPTDAMHGSRGNG